MVAPPNVPPMSPRHAKANREGGSSPWLIAICIVVVLALGVGGGYYLYQYKKNQVARQAYLAELEASKLAEAGATPTAVDSMAHEPADIAQTPSSSTGLSQEELKLTLENTKWQSIEVGRVMLPMPACFTIDGRDTNWVVMNCDRVRLEYRFYDYGDWSMDEIIQRTRQSLSEIKYEREKDNWKVVQGYDTRDMGVYERIYDTGNGLADFTMYYPRQDHKTVMERFGTKLSRSFK